MILIDSNIFMYAAGEPHECKEASGEFLRRVVQGALDVAINAEVLQEILHRYRSIRRWEKGQEVYSLARRIIPLVLPVTAEITDLARDLMNEQGSLSARDALHVACYLHVGAEVICSFDRDLDRVKAVKRLEPRELLGKLV